jgi:hypothetical protein
LLSFLRNKSVNRSINVSSTEKSTAIGLSDEIVFINVCPVVIAEPNLTWEIPIVPLKGA